MATRITNRALINNSLNNIFKLNENLEKVQTRISTGKQINKLSDDAVKIKEILNLKSSINHNGQFVRNIQRGKLFLNASDSALGDITKQLDRARELASAQANGIMTATTRAFAAIEIDQIISQVVSTGNMKIEGKYIFSGQKVLTPPFSSSASGAVYQGDRNELSMAIDDNSKIGISVAGSDVLGADMDPGINGLTILSDLNKGQGISAGSFSITDREGNSAIVSITSGMTVNDAVNAINGSLGNISASINSDNTGILINDNSANPTQNLVVSDIGSGTTASDLGVVGNVDGSINGLDLDTSITSSTQLSLMKGGSGLTLTSIAIVNGSASGAVSFSSATTIGDVINAINNSGLNVTASINNSGNGLRVTSNSASTTAVVNEVGTGSSAADLGIMGSNNVIETLLALKESLEKDDVSGILASLDNINSGIKHLSSMRGAIGARTNRLETVKVIHEQRKVDTKENLSNIEDADFIKEQMEFLSLQNAFNATLNVTAKIIQQSLLDFIR